MVFSLLGICFGLLHAEHQNNAFLPGDAFFSSSVTQDEAAEVKTEEDVIYPKIGGLFRS